jgi:pimeloyl-ACP methyl ester carboxylesterase
VEKIKKETIFLLVLLTITLTVVACGGGEEAAEPEFAEEAELEAVELEENAQDEQMDDGLETPEEIFDEDFPEVTIVTVPDPHPRDSFDGLPEYVTLDGCFVDLSFSGLQPDWYECGYVIVPADHNASGGNTMHLGVVKFLAESENPQFDPLFVAQGGPGASAIYVTPFATEDPWFEQTRTDRDIIFFDQRGTLFSNPTLTCDGYGEARRKALVDGQFREKSADLVAEAISACTAEISAAGWDLSNFDSLQNAADVNAIRAALGYDQINYYGISYGTILGQHLLRDYPEMLRSVTLDGVAPLAVNWGKDEGLRKQAALDTLIAACAANETCSQQYPAMAETLPELYQALEAEPATVTIYDLSDDELDLPLDGDMLATIVVDKMYNTNNYPLLFGALQNAADSRDYGYFANNIDASLGSSSVAMLMHFAVVCAEDADFEPEEVGLNRVSPMIQGYSSIDTSQYLAVCEELGVDLLDDFVDEPIESDQPILLLSGTFDPATPPSELSMILPGLSNAHSFTLPNGAHGQLLSGDQCAAEIFKRFLIDPTAEPDGACLKALSVNFTNSDDD